MPAAPRAPTVVILAAGLGRRMRSAHPKVLQPLCGRPMIAWVLDQARALDPERIVVVVGKGGDEVESALEAEVRRGAVETVLQEPQLGTGHALQVAAPRIERADRVVVLYGDMPCLRAESLRCLLEAQASLGRSGTALLTASISEPHGYGRIRRGEPTAAAPDGPVLGIVEERDATDEERAICEINLGVYAFAGRELRAALPALRNDNAQGEYYLTDVIGALIAGGKAVAAVELEELDEAIGVNTFADLGVARWALQARILEQHMEAGVHIVDPASTWIDHDVTIGAGTEVLPATVIRSGVVIGEGCEVGPFAHLRAGTVLEDGAEVGNFVECKSTRLGRHSKAKHLAYLGDATIGERANIGAGTIFANWDGQAKHRSVVGDGAFVGSGTVVVAPNTIGAGATTGAGAVLTRRSEVGPGEVWVGVPARKLEKSTAKGAAKGSPKERGA